MPLLTRLAQSRWVFHFWGRRAVPGCKRNGKDGVAGGGPPQSGFPATPHGAPASLPCYGRGNITVSRPQLNYMPAVAGLPDRPGKIGTAAIQALCAVFDCGWLSTPGNFPSAVFNGGLTGFLAGLPPGWPLVKGATPLDDALAGYPASRWLGAIRRGGPDGSQARPAEWSAPKRSQVVANRPVALTTIPAPQ